MSLVAPFFQLLGYDIFNPAEFCPEYTADVGIKKGEKVDYAILINGNPIILIEVKSINKNLDKHSSQLFRYFTTTNARFAILTNGITYRFYSDLTEKNKMDKDPFYEFNILRLSQKDYTEIAKFSKDCFNVSSVTDSASILMYSNQFTEYIKAQLLNPNDDFVRLFLKDSYTGVKTQNVIDRFRPILRKLLNDYIDKLVKERMTNLVNNSNFTPDVEPINKPESTDTEIAFYNIIQNILAPLVQSDEITYKKTESYFVVLYKNNVRKWLARIIISSAQMTLIIPDENKNEMRYKISTLDDVNNYSHQIQRALLLYISDNILQLYDTENYIHTKWGIYEKPVPYTIKIDYGARQDVKKVF